MQSDQNLQYFIHLTLHGLPEAHLPPQEIVKEEYDRVTGYMTAVFTRQISPADPMYPSFLWIYTTAGVHMLISEKDIDMLRLFTQPGPPSPQPPVRSIEDDKDDEEEDDDEMDDLYYGSETIGRVEIYLRGRREPIVNSTLEHPAELGQYFSMLDDPYAVKMLIEEESELIYFTDDDGEEAAVRIDRLVLLAAHPGSLRFGFEEEDEDDAGWF